MNATITYAYDGNNNITTKTTYAYTTSPDLSGGTVKTYTYGDGISYDRLTGYDGGTITYDILGNPLNYLGNDLVWTGRTLKSYNTYSYDYDMNGLRLQKKNGSTVTAEYLYDGNRLIREIRGSTTIWYLYDQYGIIGMDRNGYLFYYVRNLQGDITAITDYQGNIVAAYTYDSWGKLISGGTSGIGFDNPFRYRGYYYDTETGFYFLGSRYYDPETGRFISPDVVAENGNLYAYCQNDPVNRTDESGYLSQKWKNRLIKIGIGVALATAAVAITVATGGAALPVIASIAAGTAISAGIGAGAAAIGHRIETGSWEGAGQAALEGLIDGAIDGFLASSAVAVVGASISAVKAVHTAKQGITIGKGMGNVQKAAQINGTATYKPMKGYNTLHKIAPKTADKLSIAHNKAWINRMMNLDAKIYDIGLMGAQSAGPWYGMELAQIAKRAYSVIPFIF